MMNLPLGMILLLIVSVLVYFGIAQRIFEIGVNAYSEAFLFYFVKCSSI